MAKQITSGLLSIPFSTLRRSLSVHNTPKLRSLSVHNTPKLPLAALTTAAATYPNLALKTLTTAALATTHDGTKPKKKRKETKRAREAAAAAAAAAIKHDKEKKRTRSRKECDDSDLLHLLQDNQDHVPVMLREVLDIFASMPLRSFVDCTLGAAGHSSALIKSHPELECYVGMDVDPVAHSKARARIDHAISCSNSKLRAHTVVKNFRHITSVIDEFDENLLESGVDGVLMDLGMSSIQVNNPERGFSVVANGPLDMRMDPQASLRARDILNSWPDAEVGRILREYGEESNWYMLQNKIVQARQRGGLNSTGELRDLIQSVTRRTRGGRQGWIKTATRVFQALRIAVNDELSTLERSINACFTCLAPGGRLAVISFHSLEDRIVKQTFLNIIGRGGDGDQNGSNGSMEDAIEIRNDSGATETWIRQMVQGPKGTVLTKRPITPSEEEERLNRRSRSAKLRVIEKLR